MNEEQLRGGTANLGSGPEGAGCAREGAAEAAEHETLLSVFPPPELWDVGAAPLEEAAGAIPEALEIAGEDAEAPLTELETAEEEADPEGKEAQRKPRKPDRAQIDRGYTEKAKEPGEYLDYCHARFGGNGEPVTQVFTARRAGLSHIQKGAVCQDACAYREISHGLALLYADGVSAGKRSEVGSKFACEVAGEEIARLSGEIPDENAFVRALLSPKFYREMRQKLLARLANFHRESGEPLNSRWQYRYCTTLMIAVLSERWISVLNVGDGQILLFNDRECQSARLLYKQDAATPPKSPIYGAYLEDVQRGLWPRARYRGVLLTTDGMNDMFDKLPDCDGRSAAHNYLLQIEKRFLERGEPYQPFVYSGTIRGQERTADLSRQVGAYDDCSIVLAVSESFASPPESPAELLRARFGEGTQIIEERRVGDKIAYLTDDGETFHMVYVTPGDKIQPLRDPRLDEFLPGGARLWRCKARWFAGAWCFGVYELPKDAPSFDLLEIEFQDSRYRTVCQSYEADGGLRLANPLRGEPLLEFYDRLCALEAHLAAQNLCLNEMAAHWIMRLQGEDDALLLPWEVLAERREAPCAPWSLTIGQLFPGLIGRLICGAHQMPLFAPGGDILDEPYYRFDLKRGSPEGEGQFFRLLYDAKQNRYGMRNISGHLWRLTRADGRELQIEPGATMVLQEGDRIEPLQGGKPLFCCTARLR